MKKHKKKIIWLVIAVVVLVPIIWFIFFQPESPVNFGSELIGRRDVVQTVSVTGEISARHKRHLMSEFSGRIEKVLVQPGDQVKKGQLLVVMDNSVLRSQLDEATYAISLEEEKEKLMRRKWDDFKPEEREQQKLAIERAKAATKVLKQQMAKTNLYAPISGQVAGDDFKSGDVVDGAQSILTILQLDDFEIKADVPEADVTKLKVGQQAVVELDAFSDKARFAAEISRIEEVPKIIQGVVYYEMTLQSSQFPGGIKDGMSADIDVKTAEVKDVLAVPTLAIIKEGGLRKVELVERKIIDGKEQVEFAEREIETGLRGDDNRTQLLSGLEEGQEVVTFREKADKQ